MGDKHTFIDAEKARCPVVKMCDSIGVSTSGCYGTSGWSSAVGCASRVPNGRRSSLGDSAGFGGALPPVDRRSRAPRVSATQELSGAIERNPQPGGLG